MPPWRSAGDSAAAAPAPTAPVALAATSTAGAPTTGRDGVPVGSRTLFTGDWETGDFSQWETCQSALTNGDCRQVGRGDRTMSIVPDARQGRAAARFDIREGDVPDFGGGERSEVMSSAPGAVVREGDERWYQWSMKLPADFENPTGVWFIVMQWHSEGNGSPPLAINIGDGGTVDVGGDGVPSAPRRTLGPVRRGEWVDYTLHVKFSNDAGGGFVEGWENGRQTVPRTARATMVDDSNYLKAGIYRDTGPATSVTLDGLQVTAP